MANSSINVRTSNLAFGEPVLTSATNPFRARYASLLDARKIDHVAREAFGAAAPKSAARDMKRNNTTYIVVTRTVETTNSGRDVENSSVRGWGDRLRSLFSSSIRNRDSINIVSDDIVGLVGILTSAGQMHIVVIASHPRERRQGIGELLLIATIAEAIKIGAENATLEVRKSNMVARSLYRKYGFADVGIRSRYYSDNREDAIIMSTPAFSNLSYRHSLLSRCEAYFKVRGKPELQFDPVPYLSLCE